LLERAATPVARLTAEVLLAHPSSAIGYLYAHPEEPLSEVAWIHYGRYLDERLNGKLRNTSRTARILRPQLRVSSDVLIPRPKPSTWWKPRSPASIRDAVLDIGTGSGPSRSRSR